MSRPRSHVASGGASVSASGVRGKGNVRSKSAGVNLKAKEEEYRRINEELEAKTASLVREAEDIMVRNSQAYLNFIVRRYRVRIFWCCK